MQELRAAAVEGLTRLAHGGIEVGGVLFGVRDKETIRILAHRPLTCEYAFGPSFTLSDKDCRALEEVLAAPATDAELWELDVVGWYHSHTRSGILLSAKDQQIFERYFPQPWQIALVLRPHLFDPTRGGFFFREPDGSIHAESTLREFMVQPAGAAGTPPPPREQAPVRPEPAAAPPPASVALDTLPYPGDASRAVAAPVAEPEAIVVTVGAGSLAAQPLIYWLWGTAIFAVAFVAGFVFWTGRERPGLSLRALDHDGQLRIDWNCNARVVRQSEGGSLEIDDGPRKVMNELSLEQLQFGSITYIRTTDNVVVHLRVRVPQQGTLSETTRFLAMPGDMHPVARVSPPPRGESDRTEAAAPAPVSDEHRQTVRQLEERLNQMAGKLRAAAEAPKTPPPVSPPERRALVVPAASAPRTADSLPPPPAATTAPAAPALEPVVTPFIAPFVAPAPAALKAAYQGPATGRIVWTGKLARRGTLEILAGHASTGHMTGALPGVPVRVQALPAELTPAGLRVFTADANSVNVTEAPGAQNGWNRTVYVYSPRQAGEVVVAEAPGTQNGWSRIMLRAERGDHSIILLRWELVSGAPAAHGAGDR